jgi:Leucine-rich repeat (LRR) protein
MAAFVPPLRIRLGADGCVIPETLVDYAVMAEDETAEEKAAADQLETDAFWATHRITFEPLPSHLPAYTHEIHRRKMEEETPAKRFAKWRHGKYAGILDLGGCSLKSLPWEALSKVAGRITRLYVGSNKLTELPGGFVLFCTAMTLLHCDGNLLASLPAEIGACTALQELYCRDNQLAALPASLGACENLKELHCSDNQLESLPATLGNCAGLQDLRCDNNRLLALPAELGRCTGLQILRCHDNQLSALPAELGACTALQELDCDDNKLQALPEEIGACKALREVHCSHNQLQELPATLGACTALELLYFTHNHLSSIPATLFTLKNLRVVSTGGNPYSSDALAAVVAFQDAADERQTRFAS